MTALPKLPPIRTILAATDLSAFSAPAVHAAAVLAKAYGAELHLVHALPDYPDPLLDLVEEGFAERLFENSQKDLQEFAAKASGGAASLTRVEVKRGHAVDVILENLGRIHADLLVVGTHGRSGLKHLALGSVAEHLASNAPVDTLLVRREREHPLARPMVALKDDPASFRAAARAMQVAELMGSKQVDVVSAYGLPLGWSGGIHSREQVAARMEALSREKLTPVVEEMQAAGGEVRFTLKEGDPADVVLEAIQESGRNLLFVGSHNRPRWTAALLGDTARVFVHKASCATWLVRDLAEKHPVRDALLRDLGLA